MQTHLTRPVSDNEKQRYQQDGIVCLREAFDSQWIEFLRDLIEQNIASPSEMSKNVNEKGSTGFFFYDTFVSQHLTDYQKFVFESPAAQLVADVIGSKKINLLFDQVLAKEPSTSSRTTWHHDIPYWPVSGDKVASLWIALDPVTRRTGAVEYIKGSHRWGKRFQAVSFNPEEQYDEDLPAVPDIDAQRDQYDFACFDMQPGDCTIHHGLTVHGAPGNSSSSVRRRAYILRFTGDDARYNPRPNLQKMKRDPGIKAGDVLDCDLFPVVKSASLQIQS